MRGLRAAIRDGQISCAEIVEEACERSGDPHGQGRFVFRRRAEDEVVEIARAHDGLRALGTQSSPIAGLPISIKDNLDVAGESTAGGSKMLADRAPAAQDAVVVARLKAAGAVLMGRTNMSELAFSGVGLNPHYGTPCNRADAEMARVPGGSSAGAAVSVQEEMAVAAIGTDTGGSVRIPAAFCGLVGFKPTQRRVSRDGVLPLSTTLDCVGPLARTVEDCAVLDTVLSGDAEPLAVPPLSSLRFCVLGGYMIEDMDRVVGEAFANALRRLADAGATVDLLPTEVLAAIPELNARGTFAAAEAWGLYGAQIEARPGDVDPRVAARVRRGGTIAAQDLIQLHRGRRQLIVDVARESQGYDAILSPTVPIVAPAITELADDDAFQRLNLLILRNPSVANLLDRPSITVPCQGACDLPVGLMLTGASIAKAVEPLLDPAFGWR